SAAHAGDQDVPGTLQFRTHLRCRQVVEQGRGLGARALARAAAVHGDEAGAETLDAAVVLVAVGLVDLALAAELRLLRQHRHAERLLPAITAAFAHQRVDHDALLRIDHLAALAAATLFGRTGLVIDQHRRTLDLAQTLLHVVEVLAVLELDAAREERAVAPLGDIVGDHHDRLHAFAAHLLGDLRDAELAVDRLPAGHRHRVVVEDLVGDVDPGGDRLPDRQRTGVEVVAVTKVLEHVRGFGERRLPGPGHAFAAHVGVGVGAAVHPRDHVVAADATQGAGAFGHHGRGVVRAARAVVRNAREVRPRQRQLGFLLRHPLQHVVHALAGAGIECDVLLDAPTDHAGDRRRGQLAGARQDPRAGLVVLADDAGASATEVGIGPVVRRLLHLVLDEGVLLLHHQDVGQAAHEVAQADRLQRPGHADLVDADAEVGAGALVEAEVLQRGQHVEVGLAGGDDAQLRRRRIDH